MKDEKFEMSWEDAIRTVLAEKGEPMHYREITEKIIENGYRINYGDTPEISVGTILRLNDNLFRRVDRGVYELVETSVTERIDCDDIDWDTFWDDCVVDDKDGDDKKDDELSYKKASDFIKSSVLSEEEMELLELIVNFRLSLAKGEVCFANILDDIDVEFSDEEKKRSQSIDKTFLEKKLDVLKKQIEEFNRKAEYDHIFGNLYGALKWHMYYAAERAQDLLDNTSSDIVEFQIKPWGEFIPGKGGDKPKVVIYNENIQKSIKDIVMIYASWQVLLAVFVHEMFHAWNYFKAGKNSRSVMAIDEPMVEFETLYFLERLYDFASSSEHQLKNMVENVRNKYKYLVEKKQESIGDVAAYGFGYYLFENLIECDADSREWIETYSKKSASIDSSDKLVEKVEDALIPIYPFMSEKDVMEWFEKIIFGGKAISVTAQKSAAAKVGLDVSLRDLVLACIKTIGRKCFDVQELYKFAPIFEVCVPHCENLEVALKQQLHDLVNDGILEALFDDCYRMK